MAKYIFANNASAALAAGVVGTDQTLVLASGQGELFPSPGVEEIAPLVLRKATGEVEVMYCWQRDGDTLSVIRGREGTTAQAWAATDRVSNRLTAGSLNYWAGGIEGSLSIDSNHVFTNSTTRDEYFTENPDELEEGLFIAVGSGFQMRSGDAWRTMNAVMRGEVGPVGDVTQEALNAVAQAETYANAVLDTNALAYDPDAFFYDFPMVAVGSDGMTYRAMGDDVTRLDIGDDWEAGGGGTDEYYYTGDNIPAEAPDRVAFDGDLAVQGAVGSLAAGTWGWGDGDTLGSDTFYVRLSDGADPDTKDAGFIKYRNDIDPVTGE